MKGLNLLYNLHEIHHLPFHTPSTFLKSLAAMVRGWFNFSRKKHCRLCNVPSIVKVIFTLKRKWLVGDQKCTFFYSVYFLRAVEVTGFGGKVLYLMIDL